jgi:hypothetical protein
VTPSDGPQEHGLQEHGALGYLVFAAKRRYVLALRNRSGVSAMGKGQEKPNKGNKPKLSVKDKKEKKKEKAAAGKGG